MDYSKEWSLLGSAAVIIGTCFVIAILIYLFLGSDTRRYLHTHKYKGNKPYFLNKGKSVRINRHKKFDTYVDEIISLEDFGYEDVILTSEVDVTLYFPRR